MNCDRWEQDRWKQEQDFTNAERTPYGITDNSPESEYR